MKQFNVLVSNIRTGDAYSLMFSAQDRDHAILQMGMELGDVRASNDSDWIVMEAEEVEK